MLILSEKTLSKLTHTLTLANKDKNKPKNPNQTKTMGEGNTACGSPLWEGESQTKWT